MIVLASSVPVPRATRSTRCSPLLATVALVVVGCGTPSPPLDAGSDASSDGAPAGLALLGAGTHAIPAARIRVISTAADALDGPTDLAFRPDFPDQLWVTNRTDHSIVIFHQTGTSGQTSEKWNGDADDGAHFLAKPSGLAFGASGYFATSPTSGASRRTSSSITSRGFSTSLTAATTGSPCSTPPPAREDRRCPPTTTMTSSTR